MATRIQLFNALRQPSQSTSSPSTSYFPGSLGSSFFASTSTPLSFSVVPSNCPPPEPDISTHTLLVDEPTLTFPSLDLDVDVNAEAHSPILPPNSLLPHVSPAKLLVDDSPLDFTSDSHDVNMTPEPHSPIFPPHSPLPDLSPGTLLVDKSPFDFTSLPSDVDMTAEAHSPPFPPTSSLPDVSCPTSPVAYPPFPRRISTGGIDYVSPVQGYELSPNAPVVEWRDGSQTVLPFISHRKHIQGNLLHHVSLFHFLHAYLSLTIRH